MLRPLHNVACLGIVAAFFAGCTVSDAEPQPAVGTAVGTAAAASPASPAPDTADDEAREDQASIDLGGWSMPEPGKFDMKIHLNNPFKPCEELPDEVLAQLGWRKQAMELSDQLPYGCDLFPMEVDDPSGLYFMTSMDYSLAHFESVGYVPTGENVPELPEMKVLRKETESPQTSCVSAIETPRGLLAITYMNQDSISSGSTFCEIPAELLSSLYEVDA